MDTNLIARPEICVSICLSLVQSVWMGTIPDREQYPLINQNLFIHVGLGWAGFSTVPLQIRSKTLDPWRPVLPNHDHMDSHDGLTVRDYCLGAWPNHITISTLKLPLLHINSFPSANHWTTNIVRQRNLIGQQSTADSLFNKNRLTLQDIDFFSAFVLADQF